MIPHYLSELLLRFDAVILPGLGQFRLKNVPASIKGDTILPPGNILEFDPSLKNNDGVLANYLSEKNRISFFDACSQILEFVEKIQKELNEGKSVVLEKIGSLKKDQSEEIIFSADTNVNYNLDSFGLIAVDMPSQQKNKVEKQLETVPAKKKKFPVAAIWIIAVVFVLAAGITGVYFLKPDLFEKIGVNFGQQKQNDKTLSSANVQKNNPPSQKNDTVSKMQQQQANQPIHYYIITASFRIKENADNYSAQLNKQGHKSEIIFVPEKNLFAVSCDAYNDSIQAKQALEGIKGSVNPASWIMQK